MTNGTLDIDLKGTETEVEEPKTWLAKIKSSLFGKKENEQEVVTQLQYLEKTYKVFSEMGYKNLVRLELNDEIVYDDTEHKADDFENAIKLAYGKIQRKDFNVSMTLEDLKTDNTDTIDVEFSAKHGKGEYPLSIEVDLARNAVDTEKFLNEVKDKLNEAFGVESGDIEVDEDDDEEDEDSEEETEEETE